MLPCLLIAVISVRKTSETTHRLKSMNMGPSNTSTEALLASNFQVKTNQRLNKSILAQSPAVVTYDK